MHKVTKAFCFLEALMLHFVFFMISLRFRKEEFNNEKAFPQKDEGRLE